MFMYNCQMSGNPFGFVDKKDSSTCLKNIRQSAVRGSTSIKRAKKCSKKKLTQKNVKFLKFLGLRVKKQ